MEEDTVAKNMVSWLERELRTGSTVHSYDACIAEIEPSPEALAVIPSNVLITWSKVLRALMSVLCAT